MACLGVYVDSRERERERDTSAGRARRTRQARGGRNAKHTHPRVSTHDCAQSKASLVSRERERRYARFSMFVVACSCIALCRRRRCLGLAPNRSGGCSIANLSQRCPELTKLARYAPRQYLWFVLSSSLGRFQAGFGKIESLDESHKGPWLSRTFYRSSKARNRLQPLEKINGIPKRCLFLLLFLKEALPRHFFSSFSHLETRHNQISQLTSWVAATLPLEAQRAAPTPN